MGRCRRPGTKHYGRQDSGSCHHQHGEDDVEAVSAQPLRPPIHAGMAVFVYSACSPEPRIRADRFVLPLLLLLLLLLLLVAAAAATVFVFLVFEWMWRWIMPHLLTSNWLQWKDKKK